MEQKKTSRLINTYYILCTIFCVIFGYLTAFFSHTALRPTLAGVLAGLIACAPILYSLFRGDEVVYMQQYQRYCLLRGGKIVYTQKHDSSFISARDLRWFYLFQLFFFILICSPWLSYHHPDFWHRLNIVIFLSYIILCGLYTALLFRARVVVNKNPESSLLDNTANPDDAA